jgi:hypothetical protein
VYSINLNNAFNTYARAVNKDLLGPKAPMDHKVNKAYKARRASKVQQDRLD